MCGAPAAAVACGGAAAQGTLSLESEGDVQSSVASWSGVAEAARASHFWRPIFFFFLKKQQHLGQPRRTMISFRTAVGKFARE